MKLSSIKWAHNSEKGYKKTVRKEQGAGGRKGAFPMFGRRKKQAAASYQRDGKIPVIRSSICTGEQTAGFKDPSSGTFEELMLLRDGRDFEEFLRQYQVEESEIRWEW